VFWPGPYRTQNPSQCVVLGHHLNNFAEHRLYIDTPRMINDLPAGMPRLMQTAQGYVSTLVSGKVIQEDGTATGARPGKLVRSVARPAA
jgi:N-acyl-D-amino-acid deacylase